MYSLWLVRAASAQLCGEYDRPRSDKRTANTNLEITHSDGSRE